MFRSFPPDVVVLDTDGLLHARFATVKGRLRLGHVKTHRIAGAFTPAAVTPQLSSEAALAEGIRRLRMESGKWQRLSLLLPDSWFRINLLDLPSLPDRDEEARDVVRWSLKRTLPIAPDELRLAWVPLSRGAEGVRVLALSAVESTLAGIERVFAAADFSVALIEPIGLNIWNAVAAREAEGQGDRLFVYVRDTDFTTAVFRGTEPLFIRSRNLDGERTIGQELRLSASYLRDSLAVESFTGCWVAGRQDAAIRDTLAEEFGTTVRPVALSDHSDVSLAGISGLDAELTACTGVFTG